MARRAWITVLLAVLLTCMSASAQNPPKVQNVCPYTQHPTALACLIPDLSQTGKSQNLSTFNTTIAQVIGQLPLAAPVSGFVLGFDKKLGIPVEENQNLGSVLTERGNTVGRHKLFVGFTYQRFVFHTVDGTKLSNLPSVYLFSSATSNGVTANQYGSSTNSLSANLSQYSGIVAFGLTDRIDISVTVPFERVSLSAGYRDLTQGLLTFQGSISNPINPSAGVTTPAISHNSVAGSATGFGDLLVNMKGTIISGEKSKVAFGLEARFPTGDQYNLLGTGAYGVKPYIVFSRLGRVTPHVNLGYQWNDFSNLYVNPCRFNGACPDAGAGLPTLRLPDSLNYSAGADIGIAKRLTFVADFVGQHYFNAPRVTSAVPANSAKPSIPGIPTPNPLSISSVAAFNTFFGNAPTVGVATGAINVDNVALGLKWNPAGRLILSANALIRLDSGSLRPDRFVPLVGVSYRF
jgi:hypothetical protein